MGRLPTGNRVLEVADEQWQMLARDREKWSSLGASFIAGATLYRMGDTCMPSMQEMGLAAALRSDAPMVSNESTRRK